MEPKLRFKEFSGDWEEKKLGDIFNISAGGDIDSNRCSKEKTKSNIYPIYANSIEKSGLYGYSDIYKVEGPCITVTARGNIGFAIPRNEKFYPIVRLLVLKPREKLNTKFFSECINLTNILIESTGVSQLTSPQMSKVKVKYTSLPEQSKIADFLSTVDEKIQNQQDKITHLENIKKGFMQKIFSRKIRFKDDTGNEFPEWEEKKLGHRVEEYNFKTIKQNQYPILSSTKSGIYLQSEYFNKQAASENTLGYKIVPKGYFTYRSMSDTGEFTFNIQNIINNGIISPAYPVFKTDKDNSIFLQLLLNNSNFIKKQLLVLKEGGTRYALSFEKFCKLKVFIPCLEEQEKIADFISLFDEKIDVEKDTLEHLKEMKKGLLQQMFV